MKIIRHTESADSDLRSIFAWTLEMFAGSASERYRRLISHALQDLAEDSDCPGTQPVTDELSIYHLRHSRKPGGDPQVQRPRHFTVFRTSPTHVEILRYLHDAMDLAIAGGAEHLVTHNTRDFGRGELSFSSPKVVTPAQHLELAK